MTKTFLAILTLVSFLAISACNTIEGAGQDIQKLGSGIQKTAQ